MQVDVYYVVISVVVFVKNQHVMTILERSGGIR